MLLNRLLKNCDSFPCRDYSTSSSWSRSF